MALVAAGWLAAPAGAAFSDFVTVSSDGWHFAGDGGSVFIPMGTNYTPRDGSWAPDYFSDCKWDPQKIHRDFKGLHDLHLNTVKLNVSLERLIPTQQGPDMVTLDPNVLARLDDVIAEANAQGIRLIIVGQAGWQGYPDWYLPAGGQRGDEAKCIVASLWRQLASRYAYEKAIMSWSLSVEIGFDFFDWDAGQVLLWQEFLKEKYGSIGALQSAWGCSSWPSGWSCPATFDDVNLPFCKTGGSCRGYGVYQFDGRNIKNILLPPVTTWRDWPAGSRENESATPEFHQWLLDYQAFRQYEAAEWVKVQTDAIRNVDPNHLISMGMSMWTPLARAAAWSNANNYCAQGNWWKEGVNGDDANGYEGPSDVRPFDVREMARLVDFVDMHFYPLYPFPSYPEACDWGHGEWPGYPTVPVQNEYADMTAPCRQTGGCDDAFEFIRAAVRYAFTGKPIIVGEFGQMADSQDGPPPVGEDRIAAFNTQVVYRLAGDVVGYLGWALHDWPDRSVSGHATAFNGLFEDPLGNCVPPLGSTLCPTKWGLAFEALADRAYKRPPAPGDTFAKLVQAGRRPPTYGPYAVADSILTDENYMQLLGGPRDPVPGVSLLDDAISIGPMTTTTSSNVVDFDLSQMSPNPDIGRLIAWDARVVSQDLPELMVTGNTAPVTVRLRNTGTSVWTPSNICLSESPSLGTCHPLPAPVFPGAEVDVSFTLAAGSQEGCFTRTFRLLDQSVFPPAGRPFGESLVVDTIVKSPSSLAAQEPVVVAAGGDPTTRPEVKGYLLDAARDAWVSTGTISAFASDTGAYYGAKVAIGNLDGTDPTEVVVAHGPQQTVGSSPTTEVEVWRKDFADPAASPVLLGTIGPLFPSQTTYGLNMAIGDVDRAVGTCTSWLARGDELIVAPGPAPGAPGQVDILKVDVCQSPPVYQVWKTISPPAFTGGVTLAAVDVDGDGRREIVIGSGRDQSPHVLVYQYNTTTEQFELLAETDAFDSIPSPLPSTIHEESRNGYADGPTPPQPPPFCAVRTRYGSNVTGGDIYPDCPSTPREEIVATLGPFSLMGSGRMNEAWMEIYRYDPATGQLALVQELAGYDSLRNGLAAAVADIHGDGANELVTASGPDSVGQPAEDTVTVTVRDVEPPQVTVQATPNVLWPPDHRMVAIVVDAAAHDLVDGDLRAGIAEWWSSEPDDAPGPSDGETTGDIEVSPDGTVSLRAERDESGSGRTYYLRYAAVDASGNEGSAVVAVRCPLQAP